MDLSIIADAINENTNLSDFEDWISNNERDLANYFFGLSGQDLNDLSFDLFYYKTIASSDLYNLYDNSNFQSDQFDYFISLISVAAEKLAEIGIDSLAQTIVADLPESPSKYRLMALNDFCLVNDVRVDYIEKLPEVLEKLNNSLLLFEDDGLRKCVDVLAYYLQKAKKSLHEKGLDKIYIDLTELFQDEKLTDKYEFLNHQILKDLIDDKDPFALYAIDIERKRLEPSEIIRGLFGQINSDYFNHSRIFPDQDNFWGYTKLDILFKVLDRGKCDFTVDYDEISATDKVMLYCFFNMKKHFFTSYAVFQTVIDSLTHFFEISDHKPVFIDLGCGPLTSGCALADLIHTRTGQPLNFSYIGVDIAPAMLAKCEVFKSIDVFSKDSFFKFVLNWNDIDPSLLHELAGKNNPIIFNASYLFASRSVDPKELADYINSVAQNYSNVFFIFQNPDRTDRNEKYEKFKKYVKSETLIHKVEDILYKAATSTRGNEEVLYEILKLGKYV